jgi:hypothetical protein
MNRVKKIKLLGGADNAASRQRSYSILFFSNRCFAAFLLLMAYFCLSGIHAEIIPNDRRIQWAGNVGPDGAIPANWPMFCDVTRNIPGSDLVAVRDGSANCYDALAAAIRLCPPNQYIYMPAGIYVISDTANGTTLGDKSRIAIKGDGMGKTRLLMQGSTRFEWTLGQNSKGTNFVVATRPDPVIPIGASKITVSGSVSLLRPGMYGVLDQIDDGVLVNPSGYEGNYGPVGSAHASNRMLQQMVRITSVSANGEITFTPPAQWNYTNSLKPALYTWSGLPNTYEWFGMQDLTIDSSRNRTSGSYGMRLIRVANWWLHGVEFVGGYNDDLYLLLATRGEVRHCIFRETVYTTPGGGYGVEIHAGSTGNLFEDNIFVRKRVPIIISSGSGNVFAYNYSVENLNYNTVLQKNPSVHACYPKMNLFEGNVGQRFGADNTHGSNGYNTFFRNWARASNDGKTTTYNWAVNLDRYALNYNFVGNILGIPGMVGRYESEGTSRSSSISYIWSLGYETDGDGNATGNDPNVLKTLLRHGNYDFITGSTQWSPSIPDRTIPESLYLAAKPTWWGDLQWPAFGPDLPQKMGKIPAQVRYEQLKLSGPTPPQNVRISP